MIDGSSRSAAETHKSERAPLRLILRIVGLVATICAGIGVGVHFLGPVSTVVTLLASFSPLFVVLAVIAAAVSAAARFWPAVLAALIVVVVGVSAQLPLFLGGAPAAAADVPKIKRLQAKIRLGEADPQALVSRVRSDRVDVLIVAELTPEAVDGLAAAGLESALPFSYLQPREGGGGEGIYARYPLRDTELLPGLQHNNLRATVVVPGATPFAVYALHPLPPYPEPAWRWALELDRIAAILEADRRPLIVGADFNSTYDHERYRNLLDAGGRDGLDLIDSADYLGAGIVATYPADKWYPAVLAIDRILTRGGTPLSFERVDLPGSDHHAVMGEVLLAGVDQR